MAAEAVVPADLLDGQLNVVVFGPGVGEAILLRFPDGSIGIVDGCAEGESNPVLRLARDLGGRLRFVALTHPHGDHLLGMRDVIAELKPEEIWFAGAEHPRMFVRLWERLRRIEGEGPADSDPDQRTGHVQLRELIDALVTLVDGGKCVPHQLGDRQIVREFTAGGAHVRIHGLLPTTSSRLHAWRQFGSEEVAPLAVEAIDDVETIDREVNEISAALLVECAGARVLLGGDAEGGGPNRGWHAAEVAGKVHCAKVPHHASRGAFHRPLWESIRPDVAIVTPFQHGMGRQPPQKEGLALFAECSDTVLLTSPPGWLDEPPAVAIGGGLVAKPRRTSDVSCAVVVNLDMDGKAIISTHGRAFLYEPS